MKIVVLVKQVPDPEARVTVRPEPGPGALAVEDRWVTSFFDEVALEKALQLRDEHGGAVTAVTAGSGKAVDALRRALAFGADRAVQIADPALGDDHLALSCALAAFVRTVAPDLCLAGRAAMDDDAGFVGPAVAELLGWPHVAGALGLEVESGGGLRVTRQTDDGQELVALGLPALVTAGKGLASPRVPPVTLVMKAMRAKIEKLDLAALGLAPAELEPKTAVLSYRPPRSRGNVRMIAGEPPECVRTLLALLREQAKVL
ncbi:MAG: electron transfer flavoprotein subunit beta/FixA family protein [Deltaproteobacteria bacterium]|nr:electron transfer flavoprotein subunit beta/FixA family protein [Deltaproteobacteria bacterium]